MSDVCRLVRTMDQVHEPDKASKFASEDVISSMPEIVTTNVLDRMPIQEAVRTELENLKKKISWPLRKVDITRTTSSIIFRLGSYLQKLQELYLDMIFNITSSLKMSLLESGFVMRFP
nr:hypothetical protein [Tanacetum cinerariifolium]GEZ42999.1 hypothetical protein [Tanacetum cinerariifolium]